MASTTAEAAAGRASLTEEDEDGKVIYDHGDHMGEMLFEIEDVLSVLREAFTISLHHFWERELNSFAEQYASQVIHSRYCRRNARVISKV
jgi:hypothetical protein